MDAYAEFIDDEPSQAEKAKALVAALRKQQTLGQLGMLTGDRVLSPMGQQMSTQSLAQQQHASEAPAQRLRMALQRQQLEGTQAEMSDANAQANPVYAQLARKFGTELPQGSTNRQAKDVLGLAERAYAADQRARELQLNRDAMRLGREDARDARAQEKADKLEQADAERRIEGLEFQPGIRPSIDDAKKMKAGLQSQRAINSEADSLEAIYKRTGTELVGSDANRMEQALTAMQLEAKNIAELGALSGPDQLLMEKLAGMNPTSLKANLKGLFGTDDTLEGLAKFRSWVKNRVDSAKQSYGYRDAGKAAPSGGLDSQKQARLEELRRKKAAGGLK